jgi:hypothetical protein
VAQKELSLCDQRTIEDMLQQEMIATLQKMLEHIQALLAELARDHDSIRDNLRTAETQRRIQSEAYQTLQLEIEIATKEDLRLLNMLTQKSPPPAGALQNPVLVCHRPAAPRGIDFPQPSCIGAAILSCLV